MTLVCPGLVPMHFMSFASQFCACFSCSCRPPATADLLPHCLWCPEQLQQFMMNQWLLPRTQFHSEIPHYSTHIFLLWTRVRAAKVTQKMCCKMILPSLRSVIKVYKPLLLFLWVQRLKQNCSRSPFSPPLGVEKMPKSHLEQGVSNPRVWGLLGIGLHSRRWASEASSAAPHPRPTARITTSTLSPPAPHPWKNCLPRNQSLVPKRLGTADLEERFMKIPKTTVSQRDPETWDTWLVWTPITLKIWISPSESAVLFFIL